jgi:hypothetical protein
MTLSVWFTAGAAGHPATERYIPIGYWNSVGVAGTYLGTVTDVAPQAQALSFVEDGRTKSIRITDKTRIYIDRSHFGQKNLQGSRADVLAGRQMEIRLAKDGTAEWIKIRADN